MITPTSSVVRFTLERLVEDRGLTLADLSRRIGRDATYLGRFVQAGCPRRLDELDRLNIAMALQVDERALGARAPWSPPVDEPQRQLDLI